MDMRPAVFLYTDEAQIDDRTKRAMVKSGFLPVKVAALDAVKFLSPVLEISAASELSALQTAMLRLLRDNPGSSIATSLGPLLAKVLLEASVNAARDAARAEVAGG